MYLYEKRELIGDEAALFKKKPSDKYWTPITKEEYMNRRGNIDSGTIRGDKHSDPSGGEDMKNVSTGEEYKVEGGEFIVKKSAMEDDTVRTYKGTNKEIVSSINKAAGGNPSDDNAKARRMVKGGDVKEKSTKSKIMTKGGDAKKKFFQSSEARRSYEKYMNIYNRLEIPLDDYFEFIDDMVKKGLIDEKLKSRIVGVTADLDSIKGWFGYYTKHPEKLAKGGEVDGYDVDEVLHHFLVAGLWATNDDNDEPLDASYDVDDVSDESKKEIKRGIVKFIEKNGDLLEKHDISEESAGHDLFLDSQGHGVGFWDRDYGEDGDTLSESAKETFASDPPYVGGDGKIYFATVYAKGGEVRVTPPNYRDRTPEKLWGDWSLKQKKHFLNDHIKRSDTEKYTGYKWKGLPKFVQYEVHRHIKDGRYAKGGEVDKQLRAAGKYNEVIQVWEWGMLRDPEHPSLVISHPSGEEDAKKIALIEARKINPQYKMAKDGEVTTYQVNKIPNSPIKPYGVYATNKEFADKFGGTTMLIGQYKTEKEAKARIKKEKASGYYDKGDETKGCMIYPELGEKTDATIEFRESYGGGVYITTDLQLSGRGIKQLGDGSDNKRGKKTYQVTKKAFDKLEKEHDTCYIASLAKGGSTKKLSKRKGAQEKFDKVMREWGKGELHHGSTGRVVKHPQEQDQALAIAFSEARGIDPKFKTSESKAKGGEVRSQNEIDDLKRKAVAKTKKLSAKEIANMWNKNAWGVKQGASPKWTGKKVGENIEDHRSSLASLLFENELSEAEYDVYMQKGGEVGKGKYVAVAERIRGESKGWITVISTPVTKKRAEEMAKSITRFKDEVNKVMTVEAVKKRKNVIGREYLAKGGSASSGYYIYVTPSNTNFKPHVWKEGGLFPNKERADNYAKQLRKTKSPYSKRENLYSKVEVISSSDKRTKKAKGGSILKSKAKSVGKRRSATTGKVY